ncbi:MAG: hypothetical protein ACLU9S_05260 [Oscillospiraceae bacterium]
MEVTSISFAKAFGILPRQGLQRGGQRRGLHHRGLLNREWVISEQDKVYTKTQTIPYVAARCTAQLPAPWSGAVWSWRTARSSASRAMASSSPPENGK